MMVPSATIGRILGSADLDCLALAPSDNMRRLAGFSPEPDERACVLFVAGEYSALVVPELNAAQCEASMPGIRMFSWADADGPTDALVAGVSFLPNKPRRMAIDPEMRAQTMLALLAATPGCEAVDAAPILTDLRLRKEPDEIDLLRRSADTADQAMRAAWAACRPGATELEVAGAVHAAFLAAGAQEVSFVTVGSGPNGSYPHHDVSDRVIEPGDLVVLDIGGRRDGYASDITRMVSVGDPSGRQREIVELVEEAVKAALAVAGPGSTCEQVDRAAREVIASAGCGDQFIHRTGHGIGLSTHEPPWIMGGNQTELSEGMVFSIEPGVYEPGRFGVRLEEIVTVTADGVEILSSLPRNLTVVDH